MKLIFIFVYRGKRNESYRYSKLTLSGVNAPPVGTEIVSDGTLVPLGHAAFALAPVGHALDVGAEGGALSAARGRALLAPLGPVVVGGWAPGDAQAGAAAAVQAGEAERELGPIGKGFFC